MPAIATTPQSKISVHILQAAPLGKVGKADACDFLCQTSFQVLLHGDDLVARKVCFGNTCF